MLIPIFKRWLKEYRKAIMESRVSFSIGGSMDGIEDENDGLVKDNRLRVATVSLLFFGILGVWWAQRKIRGLRSRA